MKEIKWETATTKLFMSGFKKRPEFNLLKKEILWWSKLWWSYFQPNLLPTPVEEKLKIRRKKFENKFRFEPIVQKNNQMWNPFSNREENQDKRQHSVEKSHKSFSNINFVWRRSQNYLFACLLSKNNKTSDLQLSIDNNR